MDNYILIIDNETGELYKSLGSKEEAVINFVREIINISGIEEICDILGITLKDISSGEIKVI